MWDGITVSEVVWGGLALLGMQTAAVLMLMLRVKAAFDGAVGSAVANALHAHNNDSSTHGNLELKIMSTMRNEAAASLREHQADPHAHPTAFDRFNLTLREQLTEMKELIVEDREQWRQRFSDFRADVVELAQGRMPIK